MVFFVCIHRFLACNTVYATQENNFTLIFHNASLFWDSHRPSPGCIGLCLVSFWGFGSSYHIASRVNSKPTNCISKEIKNWRALKCTRECAEAIHVCFSQVCLWIQSFTVQQSCLWDTRALERTPRYFYLGCISDSVKLQQVIVAIGGLDECR